MDKKIEFTRNHRDLSTRHGFQFEFYCDRCGSGHRTSFKPSAISTIATTLEVAARIFGGLFGKAATIGEHARSITWEQAHDEAFSSAMDELKSEFAKCPHCSHWVCDPACWNEQKGLCKHCAPDIGVEMAAAQATRTVSGIWNSAQTAEQDSKLFEKENWQNTVRASCAKCNTPLPSNCKFCPECGANTTEPTPCKGCGAKLLEGAKFCGECGQKV